MASGIGVEGDAADQRVVFLALDGEDAVTAMGEMPVRLRDEAGGLGRIIGPGNLAGEAHDLEIDEQPGQRRRFAGGKDAQHQPLALDRRGADQGISYDSCH
jgi:hypothetical protein